MIFPKSRNERRSRQTLLPELIAPVFSTFNLNTIDCIDSECLDSPWRQLPMMMSGGPQWRPNPVSHQPTFQMQPVSDDHLILRIIVESLGNDSIVWWSELLAARQQQSTITSATTYSSTRSATTATRSTSVSTFTR